MRGQKSRTLVPKAEFRFLFLFLFFEERLTNCKALYRAEMNHVGCAKRALVCGCQLAKNWYQTGRGPSDAGSHRGSWYTKSLAGQRLHCGDPRDPTNRGRPRGFRVSTGNCATRRVELFISVESLVFADTDSRDRNGILVTD